MGRLKRKNNIKVTVYYPETSEGMEKLINSQSSIMLDILESQLGEERLERIIKYAKEKYHYKQ